MLDFFFQTLIFILQKYQLLLHILLLSLPLLSAPLAGVIVLQSHPPVLLILRQVLHLHLHLLLLLLWEGVDVECCGGGGNRVNILVLDNPLENVDVLVLLQEGGVRNIQRVNISVRSVDKISKIYIWMAEYVSNIHVCYVRSVELAGDGIKVSAEIVSCGKTRTCRSQVHRDVGEVLLERVVQAALPSHQGRRARCYLRRLHCRKCYFFCRTYW